MNIYSGILIKDLQVAFKLLNGLCISSSWAKSPIGLLLLFSLAFFLGGGGDGLIPHPPRSLMVCSSVMLVRKINKLQSTCFMHE